MYPTHVCANGNIFHSQAWRDPEVPRILIVDDEGAIRTLLSLAFTQSGYNVQTAADGPEAINLCRAHRFDVVLSDVIMPGMNGHDLARWIAEHCPATQTVLMSGYDLECQNCPAAPRCELLPKPFKPMEAVATVGQVLGASRGARQAAAPVPNPRPPMRAG